MAAGSLAGLYPPDVVGLVRAVAYSSSLLDATGERVAFVFPVGKTGNIHKLYFRTGTVTTGDTIKGGLYALDASGDPNTASAYGGMVAGTVVVADGDDTVSKVITLGTDAAAVEGAIIACVLEFNSYVAGNLNIVSLSGADQQLNGVPYVDTYNTGAWAKTGRLPILALEYDDGSFAYMPGVLPFTGGYTTLTLNTDGAAPLEAGNRLYLPGPIQFRGVRGTAKLVAAATACTATLYSAADAVLGSANFLGANSGQVNIQAICRFPVAAYAMLANTVYRAAIKATTDAATGNTLLYKGTCPSAAALAQFTANAGAIYFTSRPDAGAWTDDTTAILLLSVIGGTVDDGAGGSGGGRSGLAYGLTR